MAAVSLIEARSVEKPLLRLLPVGILLGALLFNPFLAIVSAHVTTLTPASIVVAEMSLVAAALAVALANYHPRMLPWFALIGIMVFFALTRSIALEQPEAKYLRDVILIPVFVLLGMTFDPRGLVRVVVVVHAIVLAVLVLEAVDTALYSQIFRIQDFYINTRGYEITDFWNKQSDLFVSATRPDSRLFAFIDLHRLSSIFLEPVSLGNYCIIIMGFVCTMYGRLTVGTRVFLIGGTLIALIGCDGRLGAGASVLIVAATVLASRLPRHSAFIHLPGALIAAFVIVTLGNFHGGSDDLPGRIAHTVELLQKFGPAEIFGVSDDKTLLQQSVDSGVAYMVMTQSAFAFVILWLFIVFGSREATPEQVRFTHATGIYLSLTMLVSFAFLTIKTAALLWFIYGALQVAGAVPQPRALSQSRARPLAAASMQTAGWRHR